MENAAKALLIAGGMLFAIIVLSVLALGYNSLTNVKQAQLDQELKQQIERFNTPFLAFNKKAMYGTDVVSIMNLALNNNKIYNVTYGEEYYVDVFFELTSDSVQNRVYKYTLDETTSIYRMEIDSTADIGYGATNQVFERNATYGLSTHLDPITSFLITAEHNEEVKTIIDERDGTIYKYTITYSGMADFKRKTFKCSKVEYSDTGRVNALYFKQIQPSAYGG